MPEDLTTPEGMINARLERDLEQAEKERDSLRQLLSRPVNVTGPDAEMLKDYLPKISQIPEHLATVAGEMMKAAKARAETDAAMARRIDLLNEGVGRVAEVLERLLPERPDEGPEADDRYFHMEAGAPWDGRLCKKYGLVWMVHDPGDLDPITAGETCTASHKVWKEEE